MLIPYESLDPETLKRIVAHFVAAEGTDYGHEDHDAPSKINQVLNLIKSHKAVLTFDSASETVGIVLASDQNSSTVGF